MIFKKQIRTGLKVSFILLQTMVFLSGLASSIATTILYLRLRNFVEIHPKVLVPILAASCLSVINGAFGYICLPSKKKMHFFLFTLSLAALLNIQILLAVKSNRLVDQGKPWINDNWNRFGESQRSFVENHFQCCGLETATDRSSSSCKFTDNCLAKFDQIAKSLRSLTQRSLLVLFFLETLSLCVLSFLKFGR